MKIGIVGGIALASLVIAGCGKKADSATAELEKAAAVEEAKAPVEEAKDPKEVLVVVNGKKLVRGEIEGDIKKIMETQKVPAQYKEMLVSQFAEQFVMKELIADAVKKANIKVTDEDFKKQEAEFLKAVAGQPNAPKTFEEALAKHPLGKEEAKKELELGIAFQKLIDNVVAPNIKVDEAKAKDQYDQIISRIKEAKEKAKNAKPKLDGIYAQLKDLKGDALFAKFAELAKANSDCPSKEKGGDLGEFTRGRMVPEFDKLAFSMPVGQVSEPFKTQFGWHILVVTEKIPAVEAKGDTPASPEKVKASHILIMARDEAAGAKEPTLEDIKKGMAEQEKRMLVQTYMMKLRDAAKIESTVFPQLVPQKAAPAAKIETAPVSAKEAK